MTGPQAADSPFAETFIGEPPAGGDFAAHFVQPQALLHTAQDEQSPLRARLAALGQMAAAVDELFVTHCAELRNAMEVSGSMVLAPTAVTTRYVTPLLEQAADELHGKLLPMLPSQGIELVRMDALTPQELTAVAALFRREFYPLLIPLAVDPGHPFPRLGHGTMNLLIQLRQPSGDAMVGGALFAVLMIPHSLPRWIRVPSDAGEQVQRFVWIEDMLEHFAARLFNGMDVAHVYHFRVLRCAQLHTPDRPDGDIVRLDISAPMARNVALWLANHLHLPAHTVVRNQPPLAMADLRALGDLMPARAPWYRRASTRVWRFFFGHL